MKENRKLYQAIKKATKQLQPNQANAIYHSIELLKATANNLEDDNELMVIYDTIGRLQDFEDIIEDVME